MKKGFNIVLIVLVWALSLINASGWGITYDTPTKTNYAIAIWFFYVYLRKSRSRLFKKHGGLVFFTILSFVILPLITANSWEGLCYLMMVPLVYCFSQQTISQSVLELSGYIVAALGIMVLYVYSRTEVLSGWNDNHISMIGLFSYIFYSITLYGNMTGRKLTIGLAISAFYVISLLENTNSRSVFVFIVSAVALAYRGGSFMKLARSKYFVSVALSIPFLIPIITISFPDSEIFQYLDRWSQLKYDKVGLNGRYEIWRQTFVTLLKTNLIGQGKFMVNHHNSAMAVLGVFGVIGYVCWYKILAKPVKHITKYVNNNVVWGCLMSFLLIFWQQSFDLGFVAASPNLIPYMILGIGLSQTKSRS